VRAPGGLKLAGQHQPPAQTIRPMPLSCMSMSRWTQRGCGAGGRIGAACAALRSVVCAGPAGSQRTLRKRRCWTRTCGRRGRGELASGRDESVVGAEERRKWDEQAAQGRVWLPA
jgi:hypothetical protein